MHILQDAFCIVCRSNAKQLLHFLIPESWQVIGLYIVSENCFFYLVTQDDMQTVGHFIRFRTDHAGVYVVDRFYKRIKWDGFKFWKQRGHFFINWCPKVWVSAEDIFVKAGLAFVKSHHIDLGCGSMPEILIDILLEDCMTALVNGGEYRRNRIVGIIVVCYADIAGAERCRKGMHTLGNCAAVKGKTDIRKQQLLDLFLSIRVKGLLQGRQIRFGSCLDFGKQRKKSFF